MILTNLIRGVKERLCKRPDASSRRGSAGRPLRAAGGTLARPSSPAAQLVTLERGTPAGRVVDHHPWFSAPSPCCPRSDKETGGRFARSPRRSPRPRRGGRPTVRSDRSGAVTTKPRGGADPHQAEKNHLISYPHRCLYPVTSAAARPQWNALRCHGSSSLGQGCFARAAGACSRYTAL